MKRLPPLVIRTDAGPQIGAGHLMRSLAIGEAWRRHGGLVRCVMAEGAETFQPRILKAGAEVFSFNCIRGSDQDAALSAAYYEKLKGGWLILDGYAFTEQYRVSLKEKGVRTLFIDDTAEDRGYCADLLLNYNLYASPLLYETKIDLQKVLAGCRYAPIRQEFQSLVKREFSETASKVLITMGAADPPNATLLVLKTLKRLNAENLQYRVVLGGANPRGADFTNIFSELGMRGEIIYNPLMMSEHMNWADAVITAAGSTCWELCFLGKPFMTVVLAENQRRIAESLEQKNCSLAAGWFHLFKNDDVLTLAEKLFFDTKTRIELSRNARAEVDGKGAERVVDAMMSMLGDS